MGAGLPLESEFGMIPSVNNRQVGRSRDLRRVGFARGAGNMGGIAGLSNARFVRSDQLGETG